MDSIYISCSFFSLEGPYFQTINFLTMAASQVFLRIFTETLSYANYSIITGANSSFVSLNKLTLQYPPRAATHVPIISHPMFNVRAQSAHRSAHKYLFQRDYI